MDTSHLSMRSPEPVVSDNCLPGWDTYMTVEIVIYYRKWAFISLMEIKRKERMSKVMRVITQQDNIYVTLPSPQ